MEKVLITGCSSGFGYQTALLLEKNNFAVTATTRSIDSPFRNSNIQHLQLDLLKLPERIDDYDIVVFNAGVLDAGLSENMSESSIDEMIDVNLKANVKLCNLIIPQMKQKKKGKLIFVSSMAARRPLPYLSIYNASKAGLQAYVESLYLELAPYNIDVFLIEPGYYKTALWDDVKVCQDEYEKKLKNFVNKKRNLRDVKEVSFQILKICEGKKDGLHHHFSVFDRLILLCKPILYTKIGKKLYKWVLFGFQNMKTQKL